MSKPPLFSTLGCRLNAYESEAMKALAETSGVENIMIVNTCAVTAEAVRKSRQEIQGKLAGQIQPEARQAHHQSDTKQGLQRLRQGTMAQMHSEPSNGLA